LPRENLSDAELGGKSTSDRTKRRVAHDAWFPLPVIPRLAVAPVQVVDQPNPIKKHVLKKEDVCNYKLLIINNNLSNLLLIFYLYLYTHYIIHLMTRLRI